MQWVLGQARCFWPQHQVLGVGLIALTSFLGPVIFIATPLVPIVGPRGIPIVVITRSIGVPVVIPIPAAAATIIIAGIVPGTAAAHIVASSTGISAIVPISIPILVASHAARLAALSAEHGVKGSNARGGQLLILGVHT